MLCLDRTLLCHISHFQYLVHLDKCKSYIADGHILNDYIWIYYIRIETHANIYCMPHHLSVRTSEYQNPLYTNTNIFNLCKQIFISITNTRLYRQSVCEHEHFYAFIYVNINTSAFAFVYVCVCSIKHISHPDTT